MKTTFIKLSEEKAEKLIPERDFRDANSASDVFYSFINGDKQENDGLVDIEVSFRRCKRVGFFRQTA